MGWQDRDYNPGREEMNAYFANPMGLLQYSVPIFKSAGLYIRLHFWFLLACLFTAIADMQARAPEYIPLDIALMLAVCLWHEYGHRVFARAVGGNHWEWVLWPLGGMVPPVAPRTPKDTFIANVGGITFNLLLILVLAGAILALHGNVALARIYFLPLGLAAAIPAAPAIVNHAIGALLLQSAGMILINLFPCYWFDGGYIWQCVLWPKLGQWKAMRIVCFAGMILAAPLFMLSLWMLNILGMLFWALIFADCFRRRQALAAAGPGVMDEDEISYNYMDTPDRPSRRKKLKKRWFSAARKKARRDQAEQAKIDAILAKVKDKGLHSLTWWEKRTLKKATERQRQHDLAERL